MFENRSFDNLLGRLYEPGEVASFEGVSGRDLSNPVPDWAVDADPGTAPRLVPYGTATDMNSPSPDPGEEYQHVNTQLFGLIDPPSNRSMVAQHITAPYNAPANQAQRPTMDGFVSDYISALEAETGRLPVFEEYAQIMTGYAPLQVPVISALAAASRPSTTGSARFRRRRSPTGRSFTRPPRRASWSTWNPPRPSRCTTRPRPSSSGSRLAA
jgi:phospholipase C